MQVSTPIHAPVMADAGPLGELESGQSKTVLAKSLKNDKLGVFSKLLEGLVRNTKEGETQGLGSDIFEGSPVSVKNHVVNAAKGNGKDKKNVSATKDNGAEGVNPKDRKAQRDTGILSENVSFLVPRTLDKAGAEQVQHKNSATVQVGSKEKKGALSLQNLNKNKTGIAQGTEVLAETIGKTNSQSQEALAQIRSKTEERNLKGKNNEKEGSRKSAQVVQDKKQETLQAIIHPQQAIPEKEARTGSKLAEAKQRDKRRDRVSVEVQNLRSWETAEQNIAQENRMTGDGKPIVDTKISELTVELLSEARTREASQGEGENRPVQAFEEMLAQELSQNLNSDIVKQAQIILRNGDAGTIRLALKPEFLGNVKVQLEMTENKITGHIIVESDEALRAFEREIQSLEQAFKDSGFAGASLDTALASGGEENGADQQWRGENPGSLFSERLAASTYDAASDRAEELEINPAFGGNEIPEGYMPINVLA